MDNYREWTFPSNAAKDAVIVSRSVSLVMPI